MHRVLPLSEGRAPAAEAALLVQGGLALGANDLQRGHGVVLHLCHHGGQLVPALHEPGGHLIEAGALVQRRVADRRRQLLHFLVSAEEGRLTARAPYELLALSQGARGGLARHTSAIVHLEALLLRVRKPEGRAPEGRVAPEVPARRALELRAPGGPSFPRDLRKSLHLHRVALVVARLPDRTVHETWVRACVHRGGGSAKEVVVTVHRLPDVLQILVGSQAPSRRVELLGNECWRRGPGRLRVCGTASAQISMELPPLHLRGLRLEHLLHVDDRHPLLRPVCSQAAMRRPEHALHADLAQRQRALPRQLDLDIAACPNALELHRAAAGDPQVRSAPVRRAGPDLEAVQTLGAAVPAVRYPHGRDVIGLAEVDLPPRPVHVGVTVGAAPPKIVCLRDAVDGGRPCPAVHVHGLALQVDPPPLRDPRLLLWHRFGPDLDLADVVVQVIGEGAAAAEVPPVVALPQVAAAVVVNHLHPLAPAAQLERGDRVAEVPVVDVENLAVHVGDGRDGFEIVGRPPVATVLVDCHRALGDGGALPVPAHEALLAVQGVVALLLLGNLARRTPLLQAPCAVALHVLHALLVLGVIVEDLRVHADHLALPLDRHRALVHLLGPCSHALLRQGGADDGGRRLLHVPPLELLAGLLLLRREKRDLCLQFCNLLDPCVHVLVANADLCDSADGHVDCQSETVGRLPHLRRLALVYEDRAPVPCAHPDGSQEMGAVVVEQVVVGIRGPKSAHGLLEIWVGLGRLRVAVRRHVAGALGRGAVHPLVPQ
mmetsp:Transcript_71247/g.230702  ORF Transcript_71247/g.230702 Transcript_71247/m.230702 type:complete len:773 (+) Transcript_71247:2023-4341(+)